MGIRSRVQAIAHPKSLLGREFAIAAGALAFGMVAVPWLVWGIGRLTLGPYAHGGPFGLWGDFFRGLLAGSPAFWAVLLGPYVLLLAGRALRWAARREPAPP